MCYWFKTQQNKTNNNAKRVQKCFLTLVSCSNNFLFFLHIPYCSFHSIVFITIKVLLLFKIFLAGVCNIFIYRGGREGARRRKALKDSQSFPKASQRLPKDSPNVSQSSPKPPKASPKAPPESPRVSQSLPRLILRLQRPPQASARPPQSLPKA